jgi:Ca2+-binding EF-hand superfamily protein
MSLTLEDFELFFDSDEHAQRAFSTFDANNDGQ